MVKNGKISRKAFFKWLSLILLIPFYKIWQITVARDEAFAESMQTIVIDAELPEGTYFYDRVILIKMKNGLGLFSSTCSHLGCKINKMEHGELICPCHGSRYNLKGESVRGPASEPLKKIDFEVHQTGGQAILKFKA